MPLVSIIIPYYNSEKTIVRALDSVIQQTFTDYEVILVDDGSTDNGHVVVEDYIRRHPHISFRHDRQENAGPSEARNFAAEKASGEYLAFLDADDSWHRNKLKVQVQIMKHNNIDLLGSNVHIVEGNGKIACKYFVKKSLEHVSFYKLLFRHYFYTSSILMKKSVFADLGGFPLRQKYAEDTLLYARIARKYRAVVSNGFLVYVYKPLFGAGGLSADLKANTKYEMCNFRRLKEENAVSDKKISAFVYFVVVGFTCLKLGRKAVITFMRKTRERIADGS